MSALAHTPGVAASNRSTKKVRSASAVNFCACRADSVVFQDSKTWVQDIGIWLPACLTQDFNLRRSDPVSRRSRWVFVDSLSEYVSKFFTTQADGGEYP